MLPPLVNLDSKGFFSPLLNEEGTEYAPGPGIYLTLLFTSLIFFKLKSANLGLIEIPCLLRVEGTSYWNGLGMLLEYLTFCSGPPISYNIGNYTCLPALKELPCLASIEEGTS